MIELHLPSAFIAYFTSLLIFFLGGIPPLFSTDSAPKHHNHINIKSSMSFIHLCNRVGNFESSQPLAPVKVNNQEDMPST